MSEGADSVTQETREDSRATTATTTTTTTTASTSTSTSTLTDEGERDVKTTTAAATRHPPPSSSPPPPPTTTTTTTTTTYTGRRPRCGTGGPPPSPYMWIDGRRLRSALVWVRKQPSEGSDGSASRRVSFPTSDNHLVTGYLEPANPWRHAENVSRDDLIFAYKESCVRHKTEPLQNVLVQIENLDISQDRCEELNLEGENLDQHHCEPLEEILKRVQFNKINLEGTSLDDESSIILFDMLEYYESAKYLNISSNPNIGPRGWQACSHMIKKTQCLEQLEVRDIMLNEQYMNILSRALRLVCHLHVLKLENCGLSGRAIVILVTALKMNSGIRELYLADNGLDLYDAIQLGSLLRMNNHLQLLDISNNNVQDDGVRDILEGLINQVNEDKTGKGLSILILWNNRLTNKASPYISRIVALSKTLETLNIGQNMLTDEILSTVNESLKMNRVLLQLGMQSTELTCNGIITLAEIIEANQVLQRIDLRDNSIQMRGMHALVNVMKKNKCITQIDLDDKPRIRIDGPLHQYVDLVAEIRSYCNQNKERRLLGESNEDTKSPQHPSRPLNASSRKISLTCQTLPSPSRTAASLAAVAADDEPAARNMLEPKRTSGGRLRSPAPSPIPSPVASPIPSPSRNRFVVCRVPEASLRSTDSSASSSPVTPPSLGSSPTCFFPGTSSHGTSRFRVSVVESVSTSNSSSPRSVITSPSGNVTIGFNFRTSVGSDDSSSVTKTDAKTQYVGDNVAASVETLNNVVPIAGETSFCDNVAKNEDYCDEGAKGEKVDECETETQFGENVDVTTIQREVSCDNIVNESNITMDLKSVTTASGDIETIRDRRIVYTSTKELHVPAYSCEDIASTKISIIEDKAALNSTRESSSDDIATEPSVDSTSETFSNTVSESSTNTTLGTSSTCVTYSQERASTSVQKHKSSLEKLLSLFQYPGNFFSDSTNAAVDTRTSLQENVSSVMALGDKLQQYLKEGRAKVSADNSSWFSQHGSPSRNKSVGLNVSQLQSLTDIFASFKFEPHVNLVEHGTKFFDQMKNQSANNERDIQKPSNTEITRDDKSNKPIVSNEKDLIHSERYQLTRNDESNLFDQEQKQQTKDDENDLAVKEKNQVSRNDRTDLFNLDKCQVAGNNEQMLIDQVTRNEKNLISQEKSETTNNENNLFNKMESPISRNDKNNLQDAKEEVAMKTGENFEVQTIEVTEDLQNQVEDDIINQNEYDLKDQEETVARNSEDLKDWDENKTANNDEEDSIKMRDTRVNVEENTCRICKLQRIESNSNREKRSLFESVQSKDDFANKDLVLSGEPCMAMTNVAMPSSSSCKFTTCVAVNLMNIPEYSVLELSQVDKGVKCNNTKRFSSDDEYRQEPSDDAQDLEHVKHNNVERSKRGDSQTNVEHDVVYVNDEKCLKRDDAVEEANARRTCDTSTTDSINQTSDNSFPICNIARDREAVDSISTVSMLAMSTDIGAIAFASESDGILSTSLINARAENTDAIHQLNDEVTSGMHRAVDEDRERDFMQRKKEQEESYEPVEVFDDAYRDSAHHISTSVNTRVESQISETTNSTSESQDVPTESFRERQLSAPNNVDIHRTILKNAAVTDDHPDDVDKCIDPTVFIMPYATSVDKSDADELIFCITDISTDCTSVEDELSPGMASRSPLNDVTKVMDSYFELPTTIPIIPTTTTTLLIDNPEGVHRNSQDSGIDETALTIDDTVIVEAHPLPPARGSLQESVDSGIESECSSICVRMESAAERTLEAAAATKRLLRRNGTQQWDVACEQRRDNGDVGDDNDDDDDDGDDGDDGDDFFDGEFTSDFLAKETLLIDNDSVSNIARSYLNSIKSAVVSTAQPVAELPSGTPLGVVVANEDIACPSAAVITHSPAAVHGTSPK